MIINLTKRFRNFRIIAYKTLLGECTHFLSMIFVSHYIFIIFLSVLILLDNSVPTVLSDNSLLYNRYSILYFIFLEQEYQISYFVARRNLYYFRFVQSVNILYFRVHHLSTVWSLCNISLKKICWSCISSDNLETYYVYNQQFLTFKI